MADNPISANDVDDEESTGISVETSTTSQTPNVAKDLLDKEISNIETSLHLIHKSYFWKSKQNKNYFKIEIQLDSNIPKALNKVEKVIYILHPTFKNPVREISTEYNNFLLETNCWGEFTLNADVYLKQKNEPIRLTRYIDLKP